MFVSTLIRQKPNVCDALIYAHFVCLTQWLKMQCECLSASLFNTFIPVMIYFYKLLVFSKVIVVNFPNVDTVSNIYTILLLLFSLVDSFK